MIRIGDFSKMAQVSVKTLRYYAEMGLLSPAWVDRFTSYRYYTLELLPRLKRILALKELGFSLEQVKKLLAEDLSGAELCNLVRLKKTELENQIADDQARLRRIYARLRQIELEGALPAYEIVLRQTPAQLVAGLRREIPTLIYLPTLFSELIQQLATLGIKASSSGSGMAIYFDADYHERELDVEAVVPVAKLVRSTGELVFHELPQIERMACTVFQGEIAKSSEAYQALLTWIDANGYRSNGPARGVHLQSGEPFRSVDNVVVEMQIPIQLKPQPVWILTDKEQKIMDATIVHLPAFTAIGLLYYGKNQNGEIGELWGRFNPRIAEIKDIKDGAFGLCEPPDESGAFRYLAAMSVSNTEQIPEGMDVWNVPAQTYAVFTCTLPTIGQTYQYIFETWIPQSKYQYVLGIDFEYYDENFNPEDEASPLKIFVPIREKES